LTIVNAIITTGNNIIAAVSKSDATPTDDKLKKSFDALQDLLTPHAAEEREKVAERAKSLLAEEMGKGKISFRASPRSSRDMRSRKRRS